MADIQLNNVHKSFGAVEVIRDISLSIGHGEFVVFVGPSGCGKSTLLRMIAGLETVTSGDVLISGEICNTIAARDRGAAMVFQSYALYPHMTVYDNIGFSLRMARVEKLERDARIREAARILQIEHLLERKPGELSGGQRQRVAIGRAIVRDPKIFLFDEPLSNLDAALRVDMRMELSALHHKLKATMIYVTHDQVEAMTLAERIVVLDQGEVQQVGTPLELFNRPRNQFVAGFIGSPRINFLPGKVVKVSGAMVHAEGPTFKRIAVQLDAGQARVGDEIMLGIRPHHVDLAEDSGTIKGTVELIEHLGHETVVSLRLLEDTLLTAVLDGDLALEIGDTIELTTRKGKALLFDVGGNTLGLSV